MSAGREEGMDGAKGELRRRMAALRRAMTREEAAARSLSAQRRLIGLPEFESAAAVCCYLAMGGETDTAAILSAAWEAGKRVCVPAMRPDGNYAPAAMERGAAFAGGPGGTREPARKEWVAPESVDLVVAPGMAFDARCGRVGRGGGHFDRMLGAGGAGAAFKVGLAFDFQVVAEVPMGPEDVRMDAVVTEERTIRGAGGAPRGAGGR